MLYALLAILVSQALFGWALANFILDTHRRLHRMAIQVSDLLALTTAIQAQIAAITLPAPAEDLQPVADALTGIQAELTAKFPPAA